MSFHGRSKTKRTGGRRRPFRRKRKHEQGRPPAETELGDDVVKTIVAHGGNLKRRALRVERATIHDPDGTSKQVDIQDVIETPSNPNYARRNILTKGSIIDTDAGRARVTSRPGQDGQVNAVLLED